MAYLIFLSGLPGAGKSTFRNFLNNFVIIDNDEIRKELYQLKEVNINGQIKLKGLKEEYELIKYVLEKGKFKINNNLKKRIIDYLNKYKISIPRLLEFIERIENNSENKNKEYVLELEKIISDFNIDTSQFKILIFNIKRQIEKLSISKKITIYDKIPHTRNKEVFDIFYQRIKENINNENNIVIDGNNLFFSHINRIIDFTKELNKDKIYTPYLITWWKVPLKEIKKRNKGRKFYQIVPEEVIDKMYNTLKNLDINQLNIPKKNIIDVSNCSVKELEEIANKFNRKKIEMEHSL